MSATALLILFAGIHVAQPAVPGQSAGDKFTVDVSKTTKAVKAGKKGQFVLQIKAAEGYKVSKDAPLKVKLASEGVSLAKDRLKAKDATKKPFTSPTFKVPFKGKVPGDTSIAMDATFFVCDVQICERKTAKVSVPVSVRP
ncbi:MAG: hypothetical protein AAF449_24630 [Myxococcota bacterium]